MLTHNFLYVNITNVVSAGLSELADEADSKSVGGNIVRVQVPQPAVDHDNPNPVPIGDGFGFLVYLC